MGSHNDPDNYSRITIVSSLGKLFESVLNERLKFNNEVMGDDDKFQFGFQQERSTTDSTFTLYSLLEKQKHLKKIHYMSVLYISQKPLTQLTGMPCFTSLSNVGYREILQKHYLACLTNPQLGSDGKES